ncbi:saccharopine dehydrogenase family protein [Conexibacter arvalis]|uniref:Short subunit dehydrogenase-like uncharacterized protein n=1 Tax=Conexibacter arvalis TaxID=912552 RepID=A0A840IFP2_9ACTN|nr:saccharopine dehydrogenase NADP-binding domain-containing protein [Conexibacter arvalis]MBB4663155.1 short subunit dehydrogenase-like uncharacterized protein [Conexibacter arvalis]
MADGAIAVYGATGYTGALVARELRRRGLDAIVAGRDPDKLARLAEQLGGDMPTRAVELDDRDGLRHLLGDCAVVIDCAGPFARIGEPILRAAVETGTHYVDTTGEQSYIQFAHARYGDAARAAEVAVVPAMGFDYVPGDLIAHLAAQGLEPLGELTIAYATRGVRPTRGTTRTALGQAADGGEVWRDGGWHRAPLRVPRATFPFPPPFGRQPVMPFPSGEVAMVPRHVETRTLTTLMTVETLAGSRRAAPLVPLLAPAVTLALRTPLGRLVDAVVDRLPEGPPEERRRAARFAVVAVARGEDGRVRGGTVTGSDVYGLTAATVVEGAVRLRAGDHAAVGVLSPASAFDAAGFLDALAPAGVGWALDPLPA